MESVINKAIEWFKDISEATKELTSGNVSHKACAIRGLANGSAEYLEEYKGGLSAVKWQTGEPKDDGLYIVSVSNKIGEKGITVLNWDNKNRNFLFITSYPDLTVYAWCKLSDIKPYRMRQDEQT